MGELTEIKTGETGIIGLLHTNNGIAFPKPFENDIYLYSCQIAGTQYVDGISELEPHLNEGDELSLFREPDNPYDHRAIVVRNADGAKLGYVPRKDNVIMSRLMDAGKFLFAKISEKERMGSRLSIYIRIFMRE